MKYFMECLNQPPDTRVDYAEKFMEETQIKELVRLAQQGKESAFDDLVKMYYDKVYRLAWNIVKNQEDAKEVAQQTWVKIWRKLDTFKGNSAFYTWVYRIATFTSWDLLRKKKRKAEVEYLDEMEAELQPDTSVLLPEAPRPDRAMAATEIRETFYKALDLLSEKHRTALVLREVEGLSYEEIAEVMDCRKGTVMSRIFNARRAMQEHLKELR